MEKSKNYIVFGILALVVSLVAVSLAYAGFTQTLTINGSGTVKTVKWDVHFANLGTAVTTGTGSEITAPTIKSGATSIGDYVVQLASPGDSVSYTFDVVNAGNFAAKLTGLTIGTPSCSSTKTSEANVVCNNLTYKLYDTTSNTELTAADNAVLTAKTGVRHLKIVLTYKDTTTAAQLPTADVNVSGLGITLTYTQEGTAVL